MDTSINNRLTFITGGARSGKSRLAEKLAIESGMAVTYLATMGVDESDEELLLRVGAHRRRRPDVWQTIEEPLMVAQAIESLPAATSGGALCLIDCLSLFVSNLLLSMPSGLSSLEVLNCLEENVLKEVDNLLAKAKGREDYHFLLVSNEVGMAVVPEIQLARIYRDLLGLANQRAAAWADAVYICFCGLPQRLK
ncbi:MAG: bifunctional adenosylcobinamide kinase/adenosylcobinamide-phosphate guanylyltransferase [Candidatus Obscuribacter sp.]|nr:bifunctional adenosylcobinamide kinase/adenosylcobinamide-phosphate guanylyltransferase [Candidatus Obscuribacter sp.]